MILLKNFLYLSISAKQSKNKMLTEIIPNVICLNGVFKSTNSMNKAFSIFNIKLANPAIILSNWTKKSSCYNIFNWPMSPINKVEVFKSMSDLLNSVSLYYKFVNKLKI